MTLLFKKFSLYDLLVFLVPSFVVLSILYIVYIQNIQIKVLHTKIELLSDNLDNVLSILSKKQAESDSLKKTIAELVSVLDKTTPVDPLLITAQNDMIKFYILLGGGVVVCIAGFFLISHLSGVISLKKIIPVSLYSFIQDYTPFCQTKQTFTYSDKLNQLEVMADIINNKQININVKDVYTCDFVSLSDYIAKLQINSGTIVPYTNNIQPIVSSVAEASTSQTTLAASEVINSLAPFI